MNSIPISDQQIRQALPPCFTRARMAVTVIKASSHPRASALRIALSKHIGIISRVLKDVVDILYPWLKFDIPLTSMQAYTNDRPSSQFNGDAFLTPSQDPLGWRTETLPQVVPDLMEVISVLAQYNPKLLIE